MTNYILGDSITKGVYINEEGRYVFNKDNYLNSILLSLGYAVKNFSAFGATIEKGKDILARRKDSMEKNAYVFLEFGGNDCNFQWDKVADAPHSPHVPNTSLEDYAKHYADLLDELIQDGFKPILLSLPPLDPKAFYNYLTKFLNGESLLTFLQKVENIFFWQEDYDKVLRKLAKEKSIPLIDLRAAILEKIPYESFICEDGMHLTLDGQAFLKEKLYLPIKELLSGS